MPRPTSTSSRSPGRSSSRSRSRVCTVSAAAAAVALAPLLTACGSDAHPGAAAVVDGKRISMGQLQSRVSAVRDAQRAAPQSEQMIKGSGQLTRATLDSMVRERIVRKAAGDAGISLTRREVQDARSQLEKQAGGEKKLEAGLLQQQAIAPSEIDERVRMQLTTDKLAKKADINPRSPQGAAQLGRKLAKTSRDMAIDVNPRYGKWDTKKAMLANAKDPWLRDLSGRKADQQQQLQG